MAPLGFIVQLDPFALPDERRTFAAERGGQLVGVLVAVPVYARRGWLLEDAIRDPAAPNGTMELLFFHALETLAAEGCEHVGFGLAPLVGTGSRTLRLIARCSGWLFHFAGLRAFKAKLDPDAWHPVYLGFPARERGLSAVLDSLRAFAGGSLLRFGLRTARHRAALVTRGLAWLLVPWTALLALAGARWFPTAGVQLAWILLDALLFAGLLLLAARWRAGFAAALAAAAFLDFAVGCVQAVLHNAPRVRGLGDAAVIGVALAAPLAASIFLWMARDPDPRPKKR